MKLLNLRFIMSLSRKVGSALFGSISGIAVANVTSTGVLTIPLIKKTRYQPYMAGAVEAAASIYKNVE